MKNARSIKDEASAPSTGAVIVTPGTFPAKRATVTAEVLARLLAAEKMTGLGAVSDASTTRLAAFVHYLAKEYGRDGRVAWVAWVAEYSLSADTIAAAMAAGAADWCASVRRARALLRTKAATAYRVAARVNKARAHRAHPGQRALFNGEGAPA
jgi:hypothetical protein